MIMNGEELQFPPGGPSTDKWPKANTINKLIREIEHARTKFPGRRFALAALVEELGELAEALVSGTQEEVFKEALQVACVAIRIAEEGDATEYTPDLFIALVVAAGRIARGFLQREGVTSHLVAASAALHKMFEIGLKRETVDPTFNDVTDEEAKL